MEATNHNSTVEQTATTETSASGEHAVGSSTVLFNVIVQIVNILIFFFVFKYFM
ncbi:MAG: hypothetical protein ACOZBL_00610 [Patescibacteria group bacterium]